MTDSLTIGSLLERQAVEHSDRPFLAFTDSGLAWTFAEFNREVNRAAHGLTAIGVGGGEIVGIMLPNGPKYLVLSYALKKIGAAEVGINRDYDPAQLSTKLERVRPAWIALDHDAADSIPPSVGPVRTITVGDTTPVAPSVTYDQVLSDNDENPPALDEPDTDLATILLSSGTTGTSKAILTSHRMGIRVAQGLAEAYDIGPDDCVYAPWPLHHGAASLCDVLTALLTASRAVIAPRFSASRFWPDVRRHGATWFTTVGIVQKILWNMNPDRADRDHTLRFTWGGPLPIDRDLFRARFGIATSLSYGLSEIGLATFQSLDDRDPPDSFGPVRTDLYDLKIVNDQGADVPTGTMGEIVCRPREEGLITSGYLGMDELTATVLHNGWFHTGDYGYLDERGRLYFIERRDSMIRHRGENIAPADVEAVIEQHPNVAECAVLGVPSDMGEHDIIAFITLTPHTSLPTDELQAFCAQRGPQWMIPSHIHVLPDLPKTSTGKPSLAQLRELHDAQT